MYSRRIVITGLGAVTPLGNDVEAFWRALVQARSGVAPLKAFETGDFHPSYAAEIKAFAPESAGLPRKKLKMMGRHAQMALAAATEARANAGLTNSAVPAQSGRVGVIFGVGMLNADVAELGRAFAAMRASAQREKAAIFDPFDMVSYGQVGAPQMSPLWLLRHIPNMVSAHVSIALDAQGPSNTMMTGCVAAANAIGEAARLIARGEAEVMFAGGTDARISPLAMLRYRDLQWLATRKTSDPTTVSAPFDSEASGFVNGEGAGALVLESYEHAQARGARIYAELIGYGAANDAYQLLRPHPEGRGLARAISNCLNQCRLTSDDVEVTFAPATSVPAFDRATAAGLGTAFHARHQRPVVTATRSLIGHTHAASSALDCIAAIKALNESQLPPMINLRRPIVDFDFVRDTPRYAPIRTALVAAYGFGGHAAAVGWRRCEA